MYFLFLLIVIASTALANIPSIDWPSRPQLIAFTFEGDVSDASAQLDLISGINNGESSCSRSIPITWFANGCGSSSSLQSLINAGHEIGVFSNNASDLAASIACLRKSANINGFRSESINEELRLVAIRNNLTFDSSSIASSVASSWPQEVQMIIEIPMLDGISLKSSFVKNYIGQRAPIVLSLTKLSKTLDRTAIKSLINQIMSYQDVIAVTAQQLQKWLFIESIQEAIQLWDICSSDRQFLPGASTSTVAPALDPSSAPPTTLNSPSTASPSSTPTTLPISTSPSSSKSSGPSTSSPSDSQSSSSSSKPPPSNSTTAPLPSSDPTMTPSSSTRASMSPRTSQPTTASTPIIGSTAHPSSASNSFTNGSHTAAPKPSNSSKSTTSPTPTTTHKSKIVATFPPSESPTSKLTPSPSPSSSSGPSASAGTTFVPVVLSVGGVVCAALIAVAYKVYRREDRFPPIVTGGYAFEAEDRDIYDLEADPSNSGPVSNFDIPTPRDLSYQHYSFDETISSRSAHA